LCRTLSAIPLHASNGHHSPDYLKGAATAIAGNDKANVSVVESVVGGTQTRAKGQKIK